MEADEPSLYLRKEKLSLQYAIRLAANPSNSAHEFTFPPNYVGLYEQKPKAIKSFGIRILPLLESANIKPQNIEKHFTPNIPAWCMKFSNIKPSIKRYILEEWQTSWNNSIGNKLLDIKPTSGEYQSVVRNIRKEEVVLARLRLGHTRVTHSYLLQGEEQPQCVGCDAPFIFRHFFWNVATLHK